MDKNNLTSTGNCKVTPSKATNICYSKSENFISKLRAAKNSCVDVDPCYITFEGLERPSANVQDPGPAYDSAEVASEAITVYCFKSEDVDNSKFSNNFNNKLHNSDTGISTVTIPEGSYKSILYFVNKTTDEKNKSITKAKAELNAIAKETALASLICYTGNNATTLTCPALTANDKIDVSADTFTYEVELEDTDQTVAEKFNKATADANEFALSSLKCIYGNEKQVAKCEGNALNENGYSNSFTVNADYLSGAADFSNIDPAQPMANIVADMSDAKDNKISALNGSALEIARAALNCNYGNEAKTYMCGLDGFNPGIFPIYFDNKGIAKRNYIDVGANEFIASTQDAANTLAKEFAATSLNNCGYYSNKIEINCDLGTASDEGSLAAYNKAYTAMSLLVSDTASDLYMSAVQRVKDIPGLENSVVTFSISSYDVTNGGGSQINCFIDDISYLNKEDIIKTKVAEIIYSSFYPNSIIYMPQDKFLNPSFPNYDYFYNNPNTIFYLYSNNYVTSEDSSCISCSIKSDTIRVANKKSSIRSSSLNYGDVSSIAIKSFTSDDAVNEGALDLAVSSISCMYGNQALNILTCVALNAVTNLCAAGLLFPEDEVGEHNRNADPISEETYIADSPNNADSIAITVQKASLICPCADWGGGGGGTSVSVSASSNCSSCSSCAVFMD